MCCPATCSLHSFWVVHMYDCLHLSPGFVKRRVKRQSCFCQFGRQICFICDFCEAFPSRIIVTNPFLRKENVPTWNNLTISNVIKIVFEKLRSSLLAQRRNPLEKDHDKSRGVSELIPRLKMQKSTGLHAGHNARCCVRLERSFDCMLLNPLRTSKSIFEWLSLQLTSPNHP